MSAPSKLDNGHALRRAGMTTPNAGMPCGAKDRTARVPEPEHYDCAECHRRIVALLEQRVPFKYAAPKQVQQRLPIMDDHE